MPERLSPQIPPSVTLAKLAACGLVAAVILAGLMFPFAGGFGLASNRASDVVANGSTQLLQGEVPAVTTVETPRATKSPTCTPNDASRCRPTRSPTP
ncbi:Probable bifunctional membrane-associated penicillin-binding protein PonA2/glycosyl transferase [Mycobacteroides abscessus]|nr:Probable bifunctional membrane-associated penicillin-binding protein PonA2/glycosyl transferase [Mycobacteroides abscessus]